jgi:hypothetical protein
VLCLLALLVAAIGGAALRLAAGPVDLGVFSDRVTQAVADAFGPGHRVRVGSLGLEWTEDGPRFGVRDIVVEREDGAPVASAPVVHVGFALRALAGGRFEPAGIEARDPAIALTLRRDGGVSLGGPMPDPDRARPTPAIALLDPELVGRALAGGLPLQGGAAPGRLALVGVNVTVLDERNDGVRTYEPFDVEMRQHGDGAVEGAVTAAAVSGGRWRLSARLDAAAEGRRALSFSALGFSMADLAGADAGSLAGLQLGLRLSGTLEPDGHIDRLEGGLSLAGEAVVTGPNWSAPLSPATLRFALSPARRLLEIEPSAVRLGAVAGRLSGRLVMPAPEDPQRVVRASASFDGLTIGGEPVPEVDRLVAHGAYEMITRILWIERGEALGPGGVVAQTRGQMQFSGATPGVRLESMAGRLSAASARRVWPHFIAPEAQEWFVENVVDGALDRARIDLAVPPGWLDGRPLRREMYQGEFHVREGKVKLSPELPPVSGVTGVVRATGISVRVEAQDGRIELPGGEGVVELPSIVFSSEDMHLRTATGLLEARAQGSAQALLALAEAQGLPLTAGGGLDTRNLAGDGQATIRLVVPIHAPRGAPPPVPSVEAELRNVTGRGVVEGRDLERGQFRITTQGDGFVVEGSATVMGVAARLSARQDATTRRLVMRAEVDTDDAVRARLGVNLAPTVTGPATLRLTRESQGTEATRRVEVDLTQARLNVEQVGFEKARGVPASLQVTLRGQTRVTGLDDIVLQGRGFSARGRARLNEDGTPNLVELTELRLRPDDQISARAEIASGRVSVRVQGRSLDLRPFLRNVLEGGEGEPAQQGRLDLVMRVERAVGHNGAALSDMRLETSRTGARLTELTLSGSFGGATRIVGEVLPTRAGPVLHVSSTDAGSVLRFLDLYKNMRGGRLVMTQSLSDPAGRRADGTVFIENFRVVNDRGLERLFGAAPADPQSGRRPAGGGDTAFDAMRASFVRTPGAMQISEGVLRNVNVGITFEGRLDTRRQAVDMRGVFIPAFALNNFLARIPVVGAFLGGSNEGLIGVTYAINGPLAGPTLQINPVSAIAPGFLRHIFAFDRPGGAPRTPMALPPTPNASGQ